LKPLSWRLPERSPLGSARDEIGQLWREWRAKRKAVVLRPYVDLHSRWRRAARILTPLTLTMFCFVYGFFFALTAPILIVPFTAPVLILALLSIWALPDVDTAPVKSLELFFSAGLLQLILWPNYLALALPGLPWITATRLTMFPAAFLLLLCLSSSRTFRKNMFEAADGAPVVFTLLVMMAVNSFISLPISKAVGVSLNKILVEQFTWTGMLLAGLYVFRMPRRAERYVSFLLLLVPPIALLALVEFQETHVPWLDHVPSFLKVPDPAAQLAIHNQTRSATGQYRAKATFSTGLGLAEYISLMTPFALHWAAGRYAFAKRLAGLALLPVIYIVVRMTDSRLGVLGYLVSTATYVLVWALVRFRRRINDLAAAILVYAYPAAIIGLLAASLVVHKIHVLIFGGGPQVASNYQRQEQFRMAMPPFLHNPIGYGDGQAGVRMGYGSGDFIAIDSYWIAVSLDYGAIGMVLYVGLFAVTIYAALTTLLRHPEVARGETALMIPLVSLLVAFLVIRGVYAEEGIHPLVFSLLAMALCLISRAKHSISAATTAPAAAPVAPLLKRMAGARTPSEEVKKPASFAVVTAIVLACAVAYYVACLVWSLVHHSAG
jgi:hypothetical protein